MSELYELPDGWEWKKLEEVFLIERGGSPRPIKDYITESEDGINWIKIGDTVKGEKYITQTAQKIRPEGLKKSRLVKEGDFIMSNSMSFGRPYIVKTKGAIHDGWLLMRDKLENINKDFFYYLLSSNYMYNKFSSKASGTTVKNLNISLVKSIEVPFPILKEQKRIVSKLDTLFEKIDKAIELHKKNIKEADAFMGSVLNEVFEELEEKYEKAQIKDFSIVGTGVTPLKSNKDFYENGNINWITSKATGSDYVYESEQLITKKALEQCRLKLNPIGTLIIALYGQGKTRGQVSELKIESATNQAIATIKVDEEKVVNTFLKYFFKKSYLELRAKASGGTQANLNLSIIKNIELPLPPLKTQQKTVKYLDQVSQKIENTKAIQKEKLQNLKDLKASILDQAFKGQL